MTTIHLVRHGETEWNRELRWQGHLDPPLNARGREQAQLLAEALDGAGFAAIYASDLRRASETAEIIGRRLGLAVQVDPGLREVDVGSWGGLTVAELDARFPKAVARWDETGEHGWEGGESHEQMASRVADAVRAIASRHDGQEILVVSHGGPIRALKALAEGIEYPRDRRSLPHAENCEVCVIAFQDGALRWIH